MTQQIVPSRARAWTRAHAMAGKKHAVASCAQRVIPIGACHWTHARVLARKSTSFCHARNWQACSTIRDTCRYAQGHARNCYMQVCTGTC